MDDQIGTGRFPAQGRIGAWLKRPLAYKLRWLAAQGRRVYVRTEDALFDERHRVACGGYIRNTDLDTGHCAAQAHARDYEAVSCARVRELMDQADKTGIVFDNFIDLGSGKGKACFYAATRSSFKQIIGVEFSASLVETANANKARFGADNIRFINLDAAQFCLPEGNSLVFLFNPFGEPILQKFLENNMRRFRDSRSVLAYANDKHRLCLERLGFSTLYRNQDSRGSLLQYLDG